MEERDRTVKPVPPYATRLVQAMALNWHAESDHAADGTEYGAPLCNCDRIAHRAYNLKWFPAAPL